MQYIDLRSDTVTQPTPEMQEAMFRAKVIDDTVDGDPLVHELEEKFANILGKESGLLLLSGTMANQIAIMTLCTPGDEILVPEESHIYNLETGGLSALAGVQPHPYNSGNGTFPRENLINAIRPWGVQSPQTTLVCFENSLNLNQGLTVDPYTTAGIVRVAKEYGVSVYLDGARLFNAAAALDVKPSVLTEGVDAVMVALTKGLSVPGGAILAGSRSFIERANRIRQRIGGGMRQIAGMIAASGLVAIETTLPKLAEDNIKARNLAISLSEMSGLEISIKEVQTNIVPIRLKSITASDFASRLKERNILIKQISPNSVRVVLHKDIQTEDIGQVIQIVREVLK